MKKIIEALFLIVVLIGCSLNNNPTSKVEELLGKYQGLSKEISIEEREASKGIILDKELIKKQYRNLSYEIKEETIDGETATVTAEIEVLDYKNVIEQNENNTQEEIKEKLKHTKDKITYTIDFTIIKKDNKNWEMQDLTEEQEQKLLGIY